MEWINNNTKVPIANWATLIEEEAIQQAKNLANMDIVYHHVSLMGDSHPGMGMPIGGVVATIDSVIPDAVGVDIGCVDYNTEFLTKDGWIKINNYNNQEILVFNKNNNSCYYENPIKYIKLPCNQFYHIKTKYGIDQMLCDDHKLLVVKGSHHKSGIGNFYDIKMKDLYIRNKELKIGFRDKLLAIIPNFKISSKIDLSDIELRIQIMVMADGSFIKNTNKCRCHFKKERKIKRAEELLIKSKINFEKKIDKDSTCFYFNAPIIEKRVGSLWKASIEQLNIICDEILNWDGTIIQRDSFCSKYKEDVDFIQYAFAVIGKRSTINYDNRINKETYRTLISNEKIVGFSGNKKDENINIVESIDGYKYCFTTTTGYWVMRRNGCICITGNCGMGFLETNVPVNLIKDIKTQDNNLLRTILLTTKKVIPTGFDHHKDPQDSYLLNNPPDYILDIPILKQEIEPAKYQLGTLGGGNHFIELQVNEKGNLCLMLHSGSRNFGYKIASYFNEIAQIQNGLDYKKDSGLAYLIIGSKEGNQYLQAMQFALDFAKENRRIMMERFKSVVFNLIKKYTNTISNIEIIQEVNIHHNYASLENHFSRDVWVHRKGAIRVDNGTIGIIPGSMGTASYIVKGKGNKDSFCSASHGAGRRMGRNAFNKQYSLKEAEAAMGGIEHLEWSKDRKGKIDLSESPAAYKDIDSVINSQLDLIDIIMKLKPIGNLKC